eukprot:104683_1
MATTTKKKRTIKEVTKNETDDSPPKKKSKHNDNDTNKLNQNAITTAMAQKVKELKSLRMEKKNTLKRIQSKLSKARSSYDEKNGKIKKEIYSLMKKKEAKSGTKYCRSCMEQCDENHEIVKCAICKIKLCSDCVGQRCEQEDWDCEVVTCQAKKCKASAFTKEKCGRILCDFGANNDGPCTFYHVKQCGCPKSEY